MSTQANNEGQGRAADLGLLHTLGLRAQAEHLVRVHDAASFAAARAQAMAPVHILGGGSNLVPARQVDGTVLKVELRGRRLLGEDARAWYVAAAAGENWHELVQWTLANGWPGLENLSLIPGTVGAAPMQNIGAYGVELKDRFDSLLAWGLDGAGERRFTQQECEFGYRDSVFKRGEAGCWLIAEVVLRLPKPWAPVLDYGDLRGRLAGAAATPQAVADAVIAVRRSKLPDPAVLGNAGSFFHNPIVPGDQAVRLQVDHPDMPVYPRADGSAKLAAGWLIEQVGWKGRRLGPVGMYEKQALVLVNHGGADAGDVYALMRAVQADVGERFGVTLRPEPEWWGGDSSAPALTMRREGIP